MEEIKQELRELLKAIDTCNKYNSDTQEDKSFRLNKISAFVDAHTTLFTNQLHRLVRELDQE